MSFIDDFIRVEDGPQPVFSAPAEVAHELSACSIVMGALAMWSPLRELAFEPFPIGEIKFALAVHQICLKAAFVLIA